MNVMGDTRRLMPGFVAVQSAPGGGSSRRGSASAAPPSTRDTQQALHPFNGRRRTSVAQSSTTPEMPQHAFQQPVSPTKQSYGIGGLGSAGVPSIQFPLSSPATPTKKNGSGTPHGSEMASGPTGSGRSPTAAIFPDRRGSSTAIRMNSVVFDESPMAHLSAINEASYDMAQNSPDPSRRASKAYELNQPTSAEKLYRVGNYHLRKVKGLSPFKLALITLLTLTTVYCLLLVVRVTVNSIAMKSNTRSKGDFRRASQRAADLSKGMLKGDSAPIVGQRSTADQRARKAWGRGSRSKNEPIRPVRPAIVDDEDDDYDDDCLPLESEVSDDERERRIRESISRAAQRVRKEDLLLQGSDKKAASSQGDATDDTDSNPKKRKKGPPRKFGSKSDLSRGSPSEGRRPANQGSQLEAQDVVAAAGPEPEPEIEETVPITLEGEASFENAPATSRVSADTAKQAATSDAMEDEQDEDSDDEDEDEETALPPPHPASKKVKAQRLAPKPAPRAPAPARKALVLTNDKKLRKTRRPIGKGTAAGARSGPAPLDSPSAMEEEPDKSAAQRLAEAEAQLVAARQQLAAQAALGARPDNARQRPLNAKVEPVQKMRMSRKGKVGGVARLGGADEARLVDEPEAPKKDAGRQE